MVVMSHLSLEFGVEGHRHEPRRPDVLGGHFRSAGAVVLSRQEVVLSAVPDDVVDLEHVPVHQVGEVADVVAAVRPSGRRPSG